MDRKIEVTERALLTRIKRRLAKDGRAVHKHRRGRNGRQGYYFIAEGPRVIEDDNLTIESLAMKYGVLKPFERIEK